jgi:hypothetical protein
VQADVADDFTMNRDDLDDLGFTSPWTHGRRFGEPQSLPNAERVRGGPCKLRLPLTLAEADRHKIANVILAALAGRTHVCAPPGADSNGAAQPTPDERPP